MYREIITANSPTFEIRIPEEMRGKKIEIIAFEIENESPKEEKLPSLRSLLQGFKFNSGGYTFNRNEANDYE